MKGPHLRMPTIRRSHWIAFLTSEGLTRLGSLGTHEVWDRVDAPLECPIIFRTIERDIPRLMVEICLIRLGVTTAEFEKKIGER